MCSLPLAFWESALRTTGPFVPVRSVKPGFTRSHKPLTISIALLN